MDIQIPNDKEISGPIMLSKNSFVELSDKIQNIDSYLISLYQKEIDKKVEELRGKEYYNGKTDDELKGIAESSLYYNKKSICVYTKDGYKVEIDKVDDLLKEETANKYIFSSISIDIKRGSYQFELNISHSEINCIRYRLSGFSESEKKDIIYQVNNWLEICKPKKVIQIWDKLNDILKFISLVGVFSVLFILLISNIGRGTEYYYTKEIKQNMISQIQNGFNNQNDINNSLKLLLMYYSDYVPENYIRPKTDTKIPLYLIFASVLIFILSLSPKTKFEIGKEQAIYKMQYYWIKTVLYIIPVMIILPVIINIITK